MNPVRVVWGVCRSCGHDYSRHDDKGVCKHPTCVMRRRLAFDTDTNIEPPKET